ncbi:MAG: GAF domain-containing protein [Gammaproteobacteria bacterium]|nr:GAF domain-containing protein [Gammaproteobacteria bacterium]
MNILMVASEAAPFLRTGYLADVIFELSLQLRGQGHDVRIVIPEYRNISSPSRPVVGEFDVPLGAYKRQASVRRIDYRFDSTRELPVYLLKNQFYFGRENPYGYLDDYERFIFFTRAALEMLLQKEFASESWQPEIIHGHDWAAGLLPFWLRHTYKKQLGHIAFVYTLHHPDFPGRFGYRAVNVAELSDLGIYPSLGESVNKINFMARGIFAADAVNTVSPGHADEITAGMPAHGSISKAVQARDKKISGILNGIDYIRYDPAFDDKIKCKFGPNRLDARAGNKQALQKTCGLNPAPDVPLLGMAGRLIHQKGFGLLEAVLETLLQDDKVQLVILGTVGDDHFREFFSRMQARCPGEIAAFFTFDNTLARKIFAGIDIILSPSLYEPCGLQQMIAMRYGAMPVARCTGGLADTAAPWNTKTEIGKGFLFDAFESDDFLGAIRDAVECYRSNQKEWRKLQQHNMGIDFSWEKPVHAYEELYAQAIRSKAAKPLLSKGEQVQPEPNDLLVHDLLEANELSITASQQDYFKQVAQKIRELLKDEAVLIWTMDEAVSQRLRLNEYSFSPGSKSKLREDWLNKPYPVFPDRGSSGRSWQYVYHLKSKEDKTVSAVQAGFLNSELAQSQNWKAQLSVPINAHGSILGRIDIFSRDPKRAFSDWEINTLGALANAMAINLEKFRLEKQTNSLLAADREMARAQTVEEIARIALGYAKNLTHAGSGILHFLDDRTYRLDHSDRFTTTADQALEPAKHGGSIRCVLKNKEQDIGWITVNKSEPSGFFHEDELALHRVAEQAVHFLEVAFQREQRDQTRANQLSKLAASLVGDLEMPVLVKRIVDTIAEVLGADASVLYLIDPDSKKLAIQAAAGYQSQLVERKIFYDLDEISLTAWIAREGKSFKANSVEELHAHPFWANIHQGNREPNAFLGIPLKVITPEGAENIIGMLKVEDIRPSSSHPEPYFTEQDELLVKMMGNVITTVIENTRLSNIRLRDLNTSLQSLSTAMMGGLEMEVLVKRIMDTIAKVLSTDAASLYLIDPDTNLLKIQAATGYHSQLVEKGACYGLEEKSLTVWIVREGKSFKAKNVKELHAHPAWAGKQNPAQDDREPNAFLGIPLKVVGTGGREETIGVLKVEDIRPGPHHLESYFTEQDELLVEMMGNVITTVIQNTRLSNMQLRELNNNLQALSAAMVGGLEMPVLVKRIVDKIADVVGADASSLYFIEPGSRKLKIQAATGYQKQLVEKEIFYDLHGKGVTAWIAQQGQSFKAKNVEELHAHPAWAGRQNPAQDNREPNAFLGIPLKVIASGRQEEVIGVLKVEDIRRGPHHPQPYFTEQDELLVKMMGNVITTVIQNTRLSDTRLRELNANLQSLSKAMVGGLEMSALVERIVDTIAEVLGADASSLYLSDSDSQMLNIQAATGYQRQLVAKGASYEVKGQGITAWIAREGTSFKANSVEELHAHKSWAGKQNLAQDDREPNAFLGIPLKVIAVGGRAEVIGVLKVEDIRPGPRHPEPYFTEQDELLINMMGNVITTVIQNTRISDDRQVKLLSQAFSGGLPLNSDSRSLDIFRPFVKTEDTMVFKALSSAFLDSISDQDYAGLKEQTTALLSLDTTPELFRTMREYSKHETTKRWYGVLYWLLSQPSGVELDRVPDALLLDQTWQTAMDAAGQVSLDVFLEVTGKLSQSIAISCGGKSEQVVAEGKWTMFNLSKVLPDSLQICVPENLPILFFQGPQWQPREDLDNLRIVLPVLREKGLGNIVAVVSFLSKDEREQASSDLRQNLQAHAIDLIFLTLRDIQCFVCMKNARHLLLNRLLTAVDLLTVSPYTIMGPTADNMFFGRENELREISEHIASASYAIIGGRRVGKTSVLSHLHRIRLPGIGFHTIFHDCSPIRISEDFLSKTFSELMETPAKDKPLVLLLDEADKLIPADRANDWALFNTMRALVNSGRARIVLSGERVLREALRNSASPLFNFANEVLLGALDFRAVEELITRPMKQLGIELADEAEMVKRIYVFPFGHPNIVQRLCRRLIIRLNDKRTRRIQLDDVNEVIKDPGFQRDDFLDTCWERASSLEKIISLLMADDDNICTLSTIQKALENRCNLRPKTGEVDDALQQLVDLRSILRRTSKGYEFAVEAFPLVVAETMTLGDMLEILTEEYVSPPD